MKTPLEYIKHDDHCIFKNKMLVFIIQRWLINRMNILEELNQSCLEKSGVEILPVSFNIAGKIPFLISFQKYALVGLVGKV